MTDTHYTTAVKTATNRRRVTPKVCALDECEATFWPRAGQRYCCVAHREANAKCPGCGIPTEPHRGSRGKEGGGLYCSTCTREREARRTAAKYGITIDEYRERSLAQDDRCAICRCPETAASKSGGVRQLTVDHDHITGAVRGLLCSRCNVALGMLNDDPQRLDAAANYLRGAR